MCLPWRYPINLGPLSNIPAWSAKAETLPKIIVPCTHVYTSFPRWKVKPFKKITAVARDSDSGLCR